MDNLLDRRALRVWENEGGAVAEAAAPLMYPSRDRNLETHRLASVDRAHPSRQTIENTFVQHLKQEGALQ